MKKITLFLFGLVMSLHLFAKDDFLNVNSAETVKESATFGPRSNRKRIYDPSKMKSRLCWIPATVLLGSGGMIFVISGVFNAASHERDPVKAGEMNRERYTYMAVGAGMMVSSIPLFILARHYRNQGMYHTSIRFKLEPVDGYMGQSTQAAAIALNVTL